MAFPKPKGESWRVLPKSGIGPGLSTPRPPSLASHTLGFCSCFLPGIALQFKSSTKPSPQGGAERALKNILGEGT